VSGEEALGLTGRLEPPHGTFPLTGGLMGIFGAIIQVSVLPMLHTGEDLPFGCAIARQLIGDDHSGNIRQPFEELPEELLGGVRVAPPLHQDIEHVAILVDGAPEIVPLPVNGEKDFIQVPLVARLGPAPAKPIGVGLSKLPAPIPYRFMRHRDTTFGHEFLDIAVTEGKAVVQPHTVANDLGRKPMTLIQVGGHWWVHTVSMPHPAETVKLIN
jgi:hypothetical protein